MEVNLFGLAALTQLVIPHMRNQRWGRNINLTSVGGLQATPYGGWYHATKFAVEGLSSSLRQELSPFGVQVIVVRPGAIKTEWSSISARSLLEVSGRGPYARAAQALATFFSNEKFEKLAQPPSIIADVVEKAVKARSPATSYTAPRAARWMVFLGRLVGSDRVRDTLTRTFMNLPVKM